MEEAPSSAQPHDKKCVRSETVFYLKICQQRLILSWIILY